MLRSFRIDPMLASFPGSIRSTGSIQASILSGLTRSPPEMIRDTFRVSHGFPESMRRSLPGLSRNFTGLSKLPRYAIRRAEARQDARESCPEWFHRAGVRVTWARFDQRRSVERAARSVLQHIRSTVYPEGHNDFRTYRSFAGLRRRCTLRLPSQPRTAPPEDSHRVGSRRRCRGDVGCGGRFRSRYRGPSPHRSAPQLDALALDPLLLPTLLPKG